MNVFVENDVLEEQCMKDDTKFIEIYQQLCIYKKGIRLNQGIFMKFAICLQFFISLKCFYRNDAQTSFWI